MTKFLIEGEGSPVGSIGAFTRKRFRRVVERATPADAALAAYETHEHIPGGVDGVTVTDLDARCEQARTEAQAKANKERRDYCIRVDHMSNYFAWPREDPGGQALGTLVDIVIPDMSRPF